AQSEEAESHFSEAIQIGEKTLGGDHPEYGILVVNMAMFHRKRMQHDEALRLVKQARQIFQNALGEEHPHTQSTGRFLEANG
ncbi:MAG: tetratricopeptide repeat protein, partial [SAR324 cluster bacterium]|nr:tetratricopeptide repeat protein [SAR324 cluster bacterium]